jgi:glycosyltransferase involved in cell wall biosynthesis
MAEQMRIVHIIPSLARAGAERVAVDICRQLQQMPGVEAALVCLSQSNDYAKESEAIRLIQLPTTFQFRLFGKSNGNLLTLLNWLESFRPHILHSHIYLADLLSRQKILKGVSYISHVHGRTTPYEIPSLQKFFSKAGLIQIAERKRIRKLYIQCKNHFIANSTFTAQYVSKSLAWPAAGIAVLPNAVNRQQFQPVSRKPGEVIELIYAGRLVTDKNPLFLVDVVNKIRKAGVRVRLKIFGVGILLNPLREKISELNLADCISIHAPVADLGEEFRKAFLYVHSAVYEPYGLTMLEAMSTGLPVICLDAGGNRDFMENGVNGFMLNESNAEMFAERILELNSNSQLYHSMSIGALNTAEKFSIESYMEQLMVLYEKWRFETA